MKKFERDEKKYHWTVQSVCERLELGIEKHIFIGYFSFFKQKEMILRNLV